MPPIEHNESDASPPPAAAREPWRTRLAARLFPVVLHAPARPQGPGSERLRQKMEVAVLFQFSWRNLLRVLLGGRVLVRFVMFLDRQPRQHYCAAQHVVIAPDWVTGNAKEARRP